MLGDEVSSGDNHSHKRTFGRTAMHKTFNLGWVSTDLGSTPRACIIVSSHSKFVYTIKYNLWEGTQKAS